MNINYREEIRLQGIPISAGVVAAKVCLFNEGRHANLPVYRVSGEGMERERNRILRAMDLAVTQLEALRQDVASRVGKAEAEIFSAQAQILQDPALKQRMLETVQAKNANAEAVVTSVLEAYESRLLEVDNEYIKDRASDIGEIKRRLLDILGNINPALQCAGQPHCQKGRNRIIVADELTPTLTLALDTEHTRGFVTERGGKTSHAAILARALGIPAVTGIKGIHGAISCGTEVLINGNTGEVIVWPSETTVQAMPAVQPPPESGAMAITPVPGLQVMANITTAADVAEANAMLAEGIGLYRTEFEFFSAGHLLNEDEQFEKITAVVKAMNGKPVTVRLLDVGGDKAAPYFEIPPEQNPYLGFRGSRFLLAHPDLLAAQARALTRASQLGPVQVLYPMIIDMEQFLALKKMFQQATRDIEAGRISHGVMFEVPSACLQARELLASADFASVGTNDLIQYLFAVDRNNERVSYDFTPDRQVFWRLLADMVRAAEEQGRPLSVCGELAGDPAYIGKLISLGIRIVSVSAKLIPAVRRAAVAALRPPVLS
ncbi:MAG: phosphoenolpyruvate--protein phosphotransferase [Verrucomicrobia bacterium]|nr:phosphoenolpyruvate--protein phosphotransferase [Verrucomicrobiota bacterium]MCG2680152.1 phosphoenolpyruvate--protein phosphotransferase [Kiritimatiellia bacterium]MBU4247061.1 phosphoenolpyruvate--protein phosphotransferase [Verrucomicrobiota bacterium]MBU4291135.1 phosphoenolpyruvate--protein phosphotransferase [Verrucomicrobiota bacterium]MBU4428015.1 phosphoenolpyruvate--protein phosphotransferase [Verrucomicrobiota bacterium]